MKNYLVPSIEVLKFQADALMDGVGGMLAESVEIGGSESGEEADPDVGQLTGQQGWDTSWE